MTRTLGEWPFETMIELMRAIDAAVALRGTPVREAIVMLQFGGGPSFRLASTLKLVEIDGIYLALEVS